MQSSGKLHLGNLLGALENWVEMQEEFDCLYFVADWHALSSNYQNTQELKDNMIDMGINWLAAGIDPEKSTLFIQSRLPQHAVLYLLLGMITPLPWLERVPSYKEKMEQVKIQVKIKENIEQTMSKGTVYEMGPIETLEEKRLKAKMELDRNLHTYGFLGYPVLQAADIILYKAHYVPVGVDQLPHLELTREIVRRFHELFGKSKKVFIEPQGKLGVVEKLPGIDGRKMSKSYGNAIFLSDPPEARDKKISIIVTDPARVRRTDKGHPEVCHAFSFHKVFTKPERGSEIEADCKSAAMGCVACKKELAKNVSLYLARFDEERAKWSNRPRDVMDILLEGTKKAAVIADKTLAEAEEAIGLSLPKDRRAF
ncbi:MAG: tryptophan--tRNA ligase [bacterium]|nr:MAG: tryptophan--tRNA ligase [bacterium]